MKLYIFHYIGNTYFKIFKKIKIIDGYTTNNLSINDFVKCLKRESLLGRTNYFR